MKLLLDESIPRQSARYFPEDFEVRTVPQMKWVGTSNGALLKLAAEHNFDALITAGKGIAYQQSQSNLPVSVVILRAFRTGTEDLLPLIPKVVQLL